MPPSRRYFWTGLAALAVTALSGWRAFVWHPSLLVAIPSLLTAVALLFLSLRPPIELCAEHLLIGRRAIRWSDIRRVDRGGWRVPLVVRLTLSGGRRVLLIYPGDLDSSDSLLRHIRRSARIAMIEGRPYREFWGEAPPAVRHQRQIPVPHARLLRSEDEDEVERLYQQLKTAGRIDSKNSTDDT